MKLISLGVVEVAHQSLKIFVRNIVSGFSVKAHLPKPTLIHKLQQTACGIVIASLRDQWQSQSWGWEVFITHSCAGYQSRINLFLSL